MSPASSTKAGQDAVFRLKLLHQAYDQVHQHYREGVRSMYMRIITKVDRPITLSP